MVMKLSTQFYKLQNLIDPQIVYVWRPEPVYGTRAGELRGYRVVVEYLTRKPETVFFDANDERVYTLHRGPADAARAYYDAMRIKCNRQYKRAMARAR